MAEAGRRVQPNVPRSTVSSIIQTFRRENRIGRQPCTGGRGKLLNEQQEQEICNMVMANNAITLRQIRAAILQDNAIFQNVNSISISTIDRILKKHQMTMKQIYRVPFERNSDRVKELRYQYVHRVQVGYRLSKKALSLYYSPHPTVTLKFPGAGLHTEQQEVEQSSVDRD
ncbi:hypothetical protein J4Q44_G00244800 [Coregonus suidteri]|uniref:Uncharacterized protein n=1 Tax=Coregonus suidteri TaxID=861788 RepID=A0AAN8LA30_9TELE